MPIVVKRIKYEDGSVYQGPVDTATGDKHGPDGTYVLPSGSIYKGSFRDDIMHGSGVFTIAPEEPGEKPEKYDGQFVDGNFEGRGKYSYSDGGVYDGEWLDGMMHGIGKYIEGRHDANDGDVYEGQYFEDEKHGFGVYTMENGCRYEGDWVQGKMSGKGIHTDSKGVKYEGDFLNDKMHGQGVMTLLGDGKNGGEKIVIGKWVRGNRIDEKTGAIIHEATDPSSNAEAVDKAVAASADAMKSQAQFRHKDSRVGKLPDEEF